MLKILLFSFFLSLSTYTSAHTGGLAGGGENKCSKAFKSSKQEEVKKGGVLGRLSRLFTKKQPPTILEELQNPNLKIDVAVWAYINSRYKFFPDNREIIFEFGFPPVIPISIDRIHTPYYASDYRPSTSLIKKGLFFLVFSTNVQIEDGNLSSFRHIIFWESDAKNTHLDESTVRQIFEILYKGDPHEIAQQNYNRAALDRYGGGKIIEPLLFRNNTDKIREAAINAIQESNATTQ